MNTIHIVLIIIVGILIVFWVAPAISMYIAVFCRKGHKANKGVDPEKEYFEGYETEYRSAVQKLEGLYKEQIEITSFDGKKLYGYYCYSKEKNEKSDKAAILFHGFRTNPFLNLAPMAKVLLEMGYDIVIPYARGHVPSEGRSTVGLLEQEDVLAWTDFVKKKYLPSKFILGGISMGGSSVGYASDRLEGVNAIIIDCAFVSPYNQMVKETRQRHMPGEMLIPIMRLCGKMHIKKDIKAAVTDSLSKTDIPAFFIHGNKDATVLVSEGIKNYEACASKKEMLLVEGAKHTAGLIWSKDEGVSRLKKFILECEK